MSIIKPGNLNSIVMEKWVTGKISTKELEENIQAYINQRWKSI